MAGKRKSGAAHAKAKKKNKKALAAAAASRQQEDASASPMAVETTSVEPQEVARDESMTESILSEELKAELGGVDGDVMVIVGKKKKEKQPKEERVTEEELQEVQKMSRSKRKKLEQLAARKVKEARRETLYKSLQDKSLSQKELDLMYTSSKLGHKETLRERLKRSMNRQKAGIDLSEVEQEELFQQKTVSTEAAGESGDESEASASDEEEEKAPVTQSAASKQEKKNKKASDPAAPAKHTQKEDVEMTEESGDKKKKRRKRAKVVHSIVPMMDSSSTPVKPTTTAPESDDEEMETSAEQTAPSAPAAAPVNTPSPLSMTQPLTSQNDAMARLEALRKKNEERRRQKELAKSGQLPAPAATTEIDETPTEVYVPKPIVLKTTQEMQQLSTKTKLSYKTTLVQLKRKTEIQMARMQLPVCSSEQEIMEAISENDVIILCGETGSGKTTQVPQFLYEAGYGHPEHPLHSGRVGVTQPRRVAAVSTAKRVAEELNVEFGSPNGHVGYQIRYDAEHVGEKTRIKFMTDGILLKEIQQDFLLRQYSILLLDEAHERNVNTDILIGLLSRIAPLRAQMAKEEAEAYALLTDEERVDAPRPIMPLKLVVMSATLRVEDFTQNKRLFPHPPPVLRVEARQYPVTVHFNKRTELDDYVSEAYKKVVKIHKKLPEGGILVFLTGQREITQLCRQLRRAYSASRGKKERRLPQPRDNPDRSDDRVLRDHDDIEEEADLEDARVYGEEDTVAYDLNSDEEADGASDKEDDEEEGDDDDELPVPYMQVLPLYSLLPNDEQMRVFDPPPEKHRLVVVATNVAETSLTIPGIKYVVDAGRTKERVFDLTSGISAFQVQWISKASADQRAGRAGRTGPGHCYRLYSSAVFDTDFAKFSPPEILCQPIEDLVLQMKAMGIHNVLQFPFPTPPEQQAIKNALTTLTHLAAITEGEEEAITPLGRVLVKFPVAARFAKMLLLAKELGVLEYTIAIVAGLSGHTPFINAIDRHEKEKDAEDEAVTEEKTTEGNAIDEMEKEWREAEQLRRHAQWVDPESDVLSLLRAAGAYAYAGASGEFCAENHLHEKTMQNMLKLRQQLTRIVNQLYSDDDDFDPIELSPRMPPPDATTQTILRQIVAAGFLDQVSRRAPPGTITEGTKIERNCAYISASGSIKEAVYIHPHSHVFTPDPAKLPPFVVYQNIMRTSRAYMKTVTAVEPEWLASIGRNTPLCRYSAPLAEPSPSYNSALDQIECFVKVQYGIHKWQLPVVKVAYPEASTLGEDEKVDASDRYRWFAKYLLDGHVVSGLQAFAHGLKEPSYMLIRKKFDKKIQLLVARLQTAQVSSRRALVAKWRSGDRVFLKTELGAWYTSEHQPRFLKAWKSIVTAAMNEEDDDES
ncbi:hypothetical protein Poli38472_007830 [Pythium oligandrum]|uniref:RNA helicase n=1 Tax=Pythium oligandrum TaxID=41045 RepID=A0A8K1FS28_PYTOL|nr:hypothetical protein Poli38472_007830 [Pythium oligandrum]|eukprot:TMW68158.1 hypothetical protein Poli38472_007830 [Pythium oligandrum]